MTDMKHLLWLFLAFVGVATTCAQERTVSIVPKPKQVELLPGTFRVEQETVLIADSDKELHRVAQLFASMVEPIVGSKLQIKSTSNARQRPIFLTVDKTLEREAYTLQVSSASVHVAGGSAQGVLYGLQSLFQLLVEGQGTAPCVAIQDSPYFGYRGAMLDVVRHFMTVDEIKSFIDILALHKLNRFHWHLTDDQGWRIEIKRYPELVKRGAIRKETLVGHPRTSSEYDGIPHGGYYTQREIREVVNYASERYIEVIPEIEMPGHGMGALTAYPELGCRGEGYEVWTRWGISQDVFCAGKESTFTFLTHVLEEVIKLFPSQYIHIGGDECPKTRWHECPYCQQQMQAQGLHNEEELQGYFTHRIEEWLLSHGRQMIGWDEILQGGVSKTATVMSWRGTKGGIAAAKAGNPVIMTPNSHCYLDYRQSAKPELEPLGQQRVLTMRQVYALDPYEGLTEAERVYIRGVQGNLWTEFIPDYRQVKHMLLPRIAAIAETAWAYDRKEFEEFRARMARFRKVYDFVGYNYATYFFDGKDE